MEKTGFERRVFNRVACKNPVRFKLKDSTQASGSLSHDISDGGIMLNLNEFVPLNSEVNMEIQLATQRIVDCVARIVWVKKVPFMDRYQAGLEFDTDRIELEQKQKIHGYTHPDEENLE